MHADHTRTTMDRSVGRRARRWLAGTAVAVGGVGFLWLAGMAFVEPALARSAVEPAQAAVAAPAAPPTTDSYADIVSRVSPAVVTIRAERVVQTSFQSPFGDDSLLRRFFGDRFRGEPMPPQQRRQAGIGSGVIVSHDGYILTNHHVVEGATRIEVELPDRTRYDATLVGSDAPSDLAVLKVDGSGLPVLPLGDSDAARVGDVVLAVGYPLGLGQTVTMGIISAKGRTTSAEDDQFQDFLQIDAPINSGNSGGALVNTRGELIGINSQIVSPSGGNIGIGFAIPATLARSVMDQLIQTGHVRRGMLGVTVQTVTSDLAASLGLDEVRGAVVGSVRPDSPAERAGIERGDVITAFGGHPVTDSNSLRNAAAGTQPGAAATMTIVRDGRTREVTATMAERPNGETASTEQDRGSTEGRLGLAVRPVPDDLAERLGVPASTGVVVTDVAADGAAADAGLRRGDVIEQANRQPVDSLTELEQAVRGAGDRPALLLVNRRGNTLFLALRDARG